jgi:PEP-CTERM motif
MKLTACWTLIAAATLACGLSSVQAADNGNSNNGNHYGLENGNNGNHHGWYKDRENVPVVGVPEPDTMLLFGTALVIGLLARGKRKR